MSKLLSWSGFLVLVYLSVAATPADEKEKATQKPLKEVVVVTAAAVKEAEKDVIGSFSLVRRETIDGWKIVNLPEALDFAAGELSLTGGSIGQLNSTFIRGASSKHTLFLVNNVRLNDPATLSLNASPFSPLVFEQVEVIDGPQSGLYGSDAMGGVVNLVPGRMDGFKMSLWGGSAASLASRISFGKTFTPHSGVQLAYSLFRTDGSQKNSDFTAHNLYAGGWLRVGGIAGQPFVYAVRGRTGIPFNGGFPSPNRKTRQESWVAGLPLQWAISEKWNIDATLGYSRHDYRLDDPDSLWDPFFHTVSRNLQLSGRAVFQGINSQSPTILGGEWLSSRIDEETDAGMTLENLAYKSGSAWIEQVLHSGHWHGVAALRYDRYSGFSAKVSPRLSLAYSRDLGRVFLSGYAVYGEGFRAPKPSEFAGPWGNPGLAPERSRNLEGGLTLGLERFSVKAGYFQTDFRNMIVYNFLARKMDNSGRDRISGWQIQPQATLGGVTASFSFMHLEAVDRLSGDRLVRRPDFVLKFILHGEWSRFSLDLLGRWVGARTDFDEATYMVVDTDSFSVFSAAAAYRLNEKWKLFVKIQNLLGREYQEILGYPAPGRTIYAGVDFSI